MTTETYRYLEVEMDGVTHLPLRSRGVTVDERGDVVSADDWQYPQGLTEATYQARAAEPSRGMAIPPRPRRD